MLIINVFTIIAISYNILGILVIMLNNLSITEKTKNILFLLET